MHQSAAAILQNGYFGSSLAGRSALVRNPVAFNVPVQDGAVPPKKKSTIRLSGASRSTLLAGSMS